MEGVVGAFKVQSAFLDALRSGSAFRLSGKATEVDLEGVLVE